MPRLLIHHLDTPYGLNFLDAFIKRAIVEIKSGNRSRMDALESDMAAITRKALAALKVIETAIVSHPTTGSARRLVKFYLRGLYMLVPEPQRNGRPIDAFLKQIDGHRVSQTMDCHSLLGE